MRHRLQLARRGGANRSGVAWPRVEVAVVREPRTRPDWGIAELALALRWTGLTLSVIAMVLSRPTRADVVGAVLLFAHAVLRTVRPIPADARPLATATGVTLDALLVAAVTGWTGLAASPYALALGASLLVAGLEIGAGVAGVAAASAAIAVGTAWATVGIDTGGRSDLAQRGGLLALICVLGAYSHWLVRPSDDDAEAELERLRSLTEVNALLLELHARAASLPGSISLRGVLASTVARLRDLLDPELVVLLLRDPTTEEGTRSWSVAVAEGAALPAALPDGALPPALREAARSLGATRRARLAPGEGISPSTGSGLYIPLWARESLVGLLAVERHATRAPFEEADVDVVADVARHAGLAIDNARWFRRLRTLGAEEERGRIARELHDRVGQSLAFVALSLDRIGTELAAPSAERRIDELRDELAVLAGEVRTATSDVREKLADLRTDTSEATDLEMAIAGLLRRVEERSGVATSFERGGSRLRPGPIVEREVWRVAQEAIVNAERHASASKIVVRWHSGAHGALLEVVDDGKGTAATAPLRRDAFGILGMRERADAIGASFALESTPGEGTTVRLRIEAR